MDLPGRLRCDDSNGRPEYRSTLMSRGLLATHL